MSQGLVFFIRLMPAYALLLSSVVDNSNIGRGLAQRGLSAGTGKLCIFGHLGLVFIWSCFVSCLLLLLHYVICAPVLTEGTAQRMGYFQAFEGNIF